MGGRLEVRIGCAIVCAAALALGSCAPAGGTPGRILEEFLQAVQDEDLGRLYCLCAGASESSELGRDEPERRANFAAWAEAELASYQEGRDAGRVELNGHGIRLVKLFALGRGTFYSLGDRRSAGGEAVSIGTRLRLGYSQVDLSGLSPGTTFYLAGVPTGRVHAVRVPAGPQEIRLDVMDTLMVDWTLVRTAAREGCAAGWAIAAAEPRPGSLTTIEVTWVF